MKYEKQSIAKIKNKVEIISMIGRDRVYIMAEIRRKPTIATALNNTIVASWQSIAHPYNSHIFFGVYHIL